MTGLPMSVSISLAIYLAERNSGRFHNHFITFSASPRLQEINGNTITEKVHYLHKAEWSMNTNLQAVFDLILDTARKYKTPKNELLEKICKLLKYGFYTAGGGKFEITINPVQKLKPLFISEKGNLVRKSVCGIVSVIPYKIARDEVSIVCSDLEVKAMEDGAYPDHYKSSVPNPGYIFHWSIASPRQIMYPDIRRMDKEH